MRTRLGRLALASINFLYFFGPNLQRSVCRLGNNAPITPSPIIAIAAISLSLLPTIEPSLSFIEIDLLPLIFARFPHGRHVTSASTSGSGRRQSARRLRSLRPSATPDAVFSPSADVYLLPLSVDGVSDSGDRHSDFFIPPSHLTLWKLPAEGSYRALFGESVRDQTDQAILHIAIRPQAGPQIVVVIERHAHHQCYRE